MNDPDLFIYNFIFELGKFNPLNISLLGGRFYVSYCNVLPIFNEQFAIDYKKFLHDNLTTANSLLSVTDHNYFFFISWVTAFIESELINYEYRQLHTYFVNRDFSSYLPNILYHIFFDLYLFENASIDKKALAFIERINVLPTVLKLIMDNIDSFSFTSLLENNFILHSLDEYFAQSEKYFSLYNVSLVDDARYFFSKNLNLQAGISLTRQCSEKLRHYSFKPVDYSQRNEYIIKTVEYYLPENVNLSDQMLTSLINLKKNFEDEFCSKLAFNGPFTELIPELNRLESIQPISGSDRLERTILIFNTLQKKFKQISEFFDSSPLSIKKLPDYLQNFIHKSIYLSTAKNKRHQMSEWMIPGTDTFEGKIYTDIIMEIIPSHAFLEKNNSISYIYQVLRIPETEEAVKHFLLFLMYTFEISNDFHILACVFHKLLTFFELGILDLSLHLHSGQDRDNILIQINRFTGFTEIGSEILFNNLLLYPGSFFLRLYVFTILFNTFESFQELSDKSNAIAKMVLPIQKCYGAPVKLFIETIQKLEQIVD